MLAAGAAAAAQEPGRVDALLEDLARPDLENWQRVERQITDAWSRSGSPAMDLLLRRGRAALDAGELRAAIEHLTALTDHAPDFAEGWNARATAFFRDGQYGPAMADLRRTLALNPAHFGALSGLGVILEEVGRESAALDAFEAAQSIHPHQPLISEAVERLRRETRGQAL